MAYNRKNPYITAVKARRCLNDEGSDKRTVHVVLELPHQELPYRVGDSIGILPTNSNEVVQKTLTALGASGEERVWDRRAEEEISLVEMLRHRRNITKLQRGIFQLVAGEIPASLSDRQALVRYLEQRELWDLIEEYAVPDLQELCDKLPLLLPRLYSIASSPQVSPHEMHLTIGSVAYESNARERRGVCSHFLCEQQPLEERSLPVYIQPTDHFLLPEEATTPVIMVGPGTGIAPFRAFIQERIARGSTGGNWLFFGDRHRATDFLYQEELEKWEREGLLRLSTAFSRDQEEKRYVQHEMWEQREELFRWLEEGAHFYVCGDAKRMAPDVEAMLRKIIEEVGGAEPKEYLKRLRSEKRYLKDVY